MMHRSLCGVWFAASLAGCAASGSTAPVAATPAAASAPASTPASAVTATNNNSYRAILTIDRLKGFMTDPNVVLVDVRSPDDYAKGHIPGAINLHGDLWRTPAQKAGKPSHDIFTRPDGSIDSARYEALLGGAGIATDSKVIVYGNHSGKADGSVPAVVLLALGHKEVGFVDGVGLERWKAAGNAVSTEPKKLASTTYHAQVLPNFVWNLEQVRQHVKNNDVVFVDARSAGEYTGTDARDNKHPGRLPGAVNVNYEDLLTKDKTTVAPAEARAILTNHGVTPAKKIVVYCQTGTRAAHEIMVMRELGYSNVSVYDGSWQEWGNRDDTPVERP
jgi:thiosulfate/3-mercaptopyruvate sulfurtransferase